jgi:hypothetical protein
MRATTTCDGAATEHDKKMDQVPNRYGDRCRAQQSVREGSRLGAAAMMRTPAARPAPVVPTQTGSTPNKWIAFAIGGVIGFFAIGPLGGGMLAARIVGGMLAGMLVGLIPLAVAKSRGDSRFADTAMTWCIISGAVLGILLAAPVAIAFTIAAATRQRSS